MNGKGIPNFINYCLDQCGQKGFQYAGLQAGTWCLCGNKFGAYGKLPPGDCDYPCYDNTYGKGIRCGGAWKNNVFLTSKGDPNGKCFIDQGVRDLDGYIELMPVWIEGHDRIIKVEDNKKYCLDKCARKKFAYAGLQAGGWCLCGNSYGMYGQVDQSQCNQKCSDGKNFCGAGWRNIVYRSQLDAAGEYDPATWAAQEMQRVLRASYGQQINREYPSQEKN